VKWRLEAEPGVAVVTVAEQLPGAPHWWDVVSVEGPVSSHDDDSRYGHAVRSVAVDRDFFRAVGASVLAGRAFTAADQGSDEHVAIVNEAFVRYVLEGRNAVGRRFQFADKGLEPGEPNPGPLYEIVGVVEQRPMTIDGEDDRQVGIYLPLGATETYPVRIAVEVGDDPTSFAPHLRRIVDEVDPDLVVSNVRPLSESAWAVEMAYSSWFWVLLVAGGIGVLLATAGIYSIMSFTVSRRTREIGVRVALGGDRTAILRAILWRALRQIGTGVAIGAAVIAMFLLNPELAYDPGVADAAAFATYLVLMVLVCGLACVVPAGRALAVQPTEALRAEG
jgi:hypothetical protein